LIPCLVKVKSSWHLQEDFSFSAVNILLISLFETSVERAKPNSSYSRKTPGSVSFREYFIAAETAFKSIYAIKYSSAFICCQGN
jgi:hypothetical protein